MGISIFARQAAQRCYTMLYGDLRVLLKCYDRFFSLIVASFFVFTVFIVP
jgi:hypothetical protein